MTLNDTIKYHEGLVKKWKIESEINAFADRRYEANREMMYHQDIVDWLKELKVLRGKPKRKAHWLFTQDGYPYCSGCKCQVKGHGGVKGYISNYCPNCGREMEVILND